MRPLLLLTAASLLGLAACNGPVPGNTSTTTTDTTWSGEVRLVDGTFLFRPCGDTTELPLEGPGVDSLRPAYEGQAIEAGQRMMAWLSSGVRSLAGRSSLPIDRFRHLDATRNCPPLPLPALVGRYAYWIPDHRGDRLVSVDLFPNGEALMLVDMPDQRAPLEQDGTWGVDSRGTIELSWPAMGQRLYYAHFGDTLRIRRRREPGAEGPTGDLVRQGPPDATAGTRGEVIAWVARTTGRTAGTMTLGTTIAELAPDTAALIALDAQARAWVPLDSGVHLGRQLRTLGDVVMARRNAARLRP